MSGGSRHAVSEPVLALMPSVMGQCCSRHRRSPFGSSLPASRSRWLSLLPRAAHSIRGGRNGRRDGDCLLGYCGVAHRVSSMDVYNEYDVCDVYKRYKNTMIREYDGYMG